MPIELATYAQLLEQRALLKEYAAECSIPEIGETNPNGEIYAAMERAGVAHVFAAFDNEQMIGFAAILTPVMPHYSQRVGTVESIFVAKSARKSGIGRELMRTVEDFARDQGCVAILYSAPSEGQFERMLTIRSRDGRYRSGTKPRYRRSNSVFVRNLG